MVQIVKRKKKGRPSKSDLAHRTSDSPPVKSAEEKDKQLRRSGRRRNVRYTFDFDDYIDEDFDYFDDDDDEDKERREKKLMLLLQLNNSCTAAESPPPPSVTRRRVAHAPTHSASSSDCGDVAKPSKKRKIDDVDDSDNNIVDDYDDDEVRSQKVEPKVIDSVPATQVDHSSGSRLPDNKTLSSILDKLQKKDIYGVYAEPVDPEELPDYHEVIKNPMDFATVRKKLGSGKYSTLEQFENDVFLICENAKQYNSSDTIYYKQASSIQELARRKFQRLRIEVDCYEKEPKTEEKATPNSFCRKQSKKPISRTLQEPVASDFSSGAALPMPDVANGSNSAQVAVFEKPSCVDKTIEGNLSSVDNNMDRGEDFQPGKGLLLKPVRKVSGLDENRRATYNISIPTVTTSESTFTTFESESKQLVPVGLNADHSYAWSLARFAATLGPVAWKVASQKIEQALPEGFKYGRGWIGEYEPLPTPVLSLGHHTVNDTVPIPNASDMKKAGRDVRAPISGQVHPVIGPTLAELRLSGPSEASTTSSYCIQNSVKEEPSRLTSLNEESSFVSLPRTRHTDHRATYQQQNLQTNDFVEPKTKNSKRVELRSPTFVNQRSADVAVEKEVLEALETQTSRSAEKVSLNKSTLQFVSCKQLNVNGVPAGRVQNGQLGPNAMGGKMAAATTDSLKQNSRSVNQYSCGQEQGLSDPVQLMRMLAEKDQRQHSLNHSPNDVRPIVRSTPFVKKEDSSNAATAAARAWMSIGAGALKPPAENTIPHSGQLSAGSLYNAANDRQPQLSRFRGEYPATVAQFPSDKSNYPLHAYVPQPVGECNEAQFQHQPMVFPQPVSPNLSRFQVQPSWRGLNPQSQHRQKQESLPPDLNMGYQLLGSPVRQSSGVMIDSQQPDLALQL